MSLEVLAILRSIGYGLVGIFAYISRSLLATTAAIVLFFLPIVQQYGSRALALKFGVLTTLVTVMLIYRVVKYEGEIRRLVVIISDAAPTAREMPRYHAKRFGRTMGVAVACVFLILSAVVLKDLIDTTPQTRDNQPLPTARPSPAQNTPPSLPGDASRPESTQQRPILPPNQNNAPAGVSGGQTGPIGPVGPAGPASPSGLQQTVDPAMRLLCAAVMSCLL